MLIDWTEKLYMYMITISNQVEKILTSAVGSKCGIHGGGIVGISLDYPWMVTVTLACADTLTGEGGHPWTIRGWSRLLWHPRIL